MQGPEYGPARPVSRPPEGLCYKTELLLTDLLGLFSFVAVTATCTERAPVIPCVEFTGQSTGCPAPRSPYEHDALPLDGTSVSIERADDPTDPYAFSQPVAACICLTRSCFLGTFPASENADVSSPRAGEVVTRDAETPYADESGGLTFTCNTTFDVPGGLNCRERPHHDGGVPGARCVRGLLHLQRHPEGKTRTTARTAQTGSPTWTAKGGAAIASTPAKLIIMNRRLQQRRFEVPL